jgi:hypothetical protein
VNELLTCVVMLDSLMVAYVEFVIMLIELKNQIVCSCSKTNTVLSEWIVSNIMDVSVLHFYSISNK